jgi:hypothetical protein
MLLSGYCVMMVALLVAKMFVRNDLWYFWLAPMLFLFYLALRVTVARPDAAV